MTAAVNAALSYFVRMGWTPAQAAGIVANLVAESGLRPDAVGDGGQAYGIAQWHPDRQQNFAAIIGHPIQGSSLEDQLAFVHAELQGTEKTAGDALRACGTASEAALVVCKLYERPADPVGESAKRAHLAENILAGSSGETPAPTEAPAPTSTGSPMPFALAGILQLIPELVGLFAKGERGQTNAKAAQVVVDAFTKAVPGAAGPGDALDKAAADPAVAAAAKAAVLSDPAVMALTEVGGGVAAARKDNLTFVASVDKWWKIVLNPVFLVTVLLIPLVYMILIYLSPVIPRVSPDVIAQTIGTIIGLVLGSITGFWMGMTYQQTSNNRRSTDSAPTA